MQTDWLARHQTLADIAVLILAAALLGQSSLQVVSEDPSGGIDKAAIIVAAALLMAVPLVRRRWPVAVFVAAGAAMAVLATGRSLDFRGSPVPPIVLPVALLYFLSLYEVCTAQDRRVADGAAAIALVGAAFVVTRLSLDSALEGDPDLVTLRWPVLAAIALGGVGASWSLGRLRRTREQDREQVNREAVLTERARIARELHDVVAHSLTVMTSQAEGGRMIASDEKSRDVFSAIAGTGRSALTDMRGLLGILRDDPAPLRSPAPSWDQIRSLTKNIGNGSFSASYREEGDPVAVGAATSLSAFRIVQEALTNALRHAGSGARADVVLRWGDRRLDVIVKTTGSKRTNPVAGGGTRSMTERARAVGGTVQSSPAPDGWLVQASLPTERMG